jgi:class 3 adenylate cyclase
MPHRVGNEIGLNIKSSETRWNCAYNAREFLSLQNPMTAGQKLSITQTNDTQTKAVLFADVSGSTRLYEVLGDQRAFAAINGCLDILRRLTETHSGRVVKTIGDEIMSVFPDAVTAAQAACEMQLVMSNQPPTESTRVAIRIGFHCGPVLESSENGDVHGDTVNLAARMASIAKSQQIITTGATVAQLPAIMRTSTRALDALSIKGKMDDVDVCEVIWLESDDMTMMVGNTLSPLTAEPKLRLVHQGREFIIDTARPSITLGRDEQADIVIQVKRASRIHAKIERRRDKFVFIDLSSNGSYLTFLGDEVVQLRREEMVLRNRGSVSLGHAYKKDPTEIVEFVCLN